MSELRMLLPGPAVVGDLDDERGEVLQALADLYAYPTPQPAPGWVRANMVSTLDGSASGPDGRSGSIGAAADHAVFSVLRGLADVILVGAGTARAEGYRLPTPTTGFAERRLGAQQSPTPTLALVTRSGRLPDSPEIFAPDALSLVVTCATADVNELRSRVGSHRVIVAGDQDVDPTIAASQLAARGLTRILLEGGPTLLGRFESAGRIDEICLTLAPLLVSGPGPRIAHGPPTTRRLRAAHLIECEGLLLGRWLVQPF